MHNDCIWWIVVLLLVIAVGGGEEPGVRSEAAKGDSPIFVGTKIWSVPLGRSHQAIPSSNTGKITADPLLSIANTNAARLNQYQK